MWDGQPGVNAADWEQQGRKRRNAFSPFTLSVRLPKHAVHFSRYLRFLARSELTVRCETSLKESNQRFHQLRSATWQTFGSQCARPRQTPPPTEHWLMKTFISTAMFPVSEGYVQSYLRQLPYYCLNKYINGTITGRRLKYEAHIVLKCILNEVSQQKSNSLLNVTPLCRCEKV